MPGICGIIDLTPDAELPPLSALVHPLAPHPWFVKESRQPTSGVQLSAVSLDRAGRMPHLAESAGGAQICVLDGEFYNRHELRRALEADGAAAVSDAAILLAGWVAGGKSFLQQINGSFAAVIWDATKRQVTLISDRFGNRPLYFAASAQRLLFGSRIKSLMADQTLSRDVNPCGLAQFFTFGHYLRDDTSLSAVRLLPAAACSTWSADTGQFRRETYHSWSEAYQQPERSPKEWIERIGDAFMASVRRQSAGTPNLGLSLSGGLDARSILAAIDVSQTPLKSICLGMRGSLDHRCAAKLAHIAGCENHSYVLDTRFLADFRSHLQRMVELTDGQYLSQCIVMPTLPVYRELGIEVLLRGHAGELMHMYKAYNYSLDEEALAISSDESLETWLLARLQAYMLDGVERPIFAAGIQRELPGLARQSLHEDIRDTAGSPTAPQRIWQLFVTQRLRRETVISLNKFRSVCQTRLPFLDSELVSLLLAAPPSLKLGEEIQQALLRRFRPEFLRVVNANTGTRVGAGPWARRWSSLWLRGAAKLGLPGYQPYERLGLWLRRELVDVVRELLLDEQTLDRGLYDADGMRAVVENHLAGRRNHTYLIMGLMIWELGQRYLAADRDGGSEVAHSDAAGVPLRAAS
jgi:asparagine synthase (glutamine-hydrolysing)